MKKLFLMLIALIMGVSGVWAEDYSQGYYTMSPGAGGYCGFYSSSNATSKYGGTSTQKNYVVFTFEKTGQDNVYYWYDCNNHKYIYADGSGYLQVADSKVTDNDNYKWFIKDDGNGNLTITDMTNYNDGNPTKGLVQLSVVGGWWASKCTFTQNSGRNTWKLNLLIKKNYPYYIGLQRADDRYLQYGSNKMQQAAVADKGVDHIWYFTDGGDGKVNIHAFTNMTAMGYATGAVAGADKIATANTVKDFYIRLTNNTSYPLAFLANLGSTLYLSNHGGVSSANMGLYDNIDDSGTRMKVEDASGFFSASQTVNLVSSDITVPYSGGAGTSESPVSINHYGGSVKLTGAEKTYYLAGSNNATQTTVTFDGTTVNYSNELGIGKATYNINNTQITTPKFITSQGGNNRSTVVNLTGNTVITVTGNSIVDSNQSSIMIGHWNGSSDLTLSGTAQIEAADAQLLVGKTGNTQTITLNGSSNITAKGIKTSASASGTNTLNLNGGSLTLGEYGITSYSSSRTISVNVTENSTITASASTLPITQPITIAAGKTLTIDGDNNTVDLASAPAPTLGTGSTISFIDATVTLNINDRDLTGYTFTSCTATAKFVETGTEYAAGGFTITNVPAGVTIKVKGYGTSDYETVTPVDGTATFSHSVGVSGSAAWLDYTFNESTKATNIHSPADQIITNAGNAGSGNNLTIDTGYNTDNSYNEDGTLKVMSTPWRDITWPTNYTVAVAGNVPDVENGCLVGFGSIYNTGNYIALIRGANQNEIKLVKGAGNSTAYQVITTMTATNATALSHLVVFTKNGDTFTVYLDGVQKAQVEYSETLGGGLQVGSLHGGVGSTGIVKVTDISDATLKAKVFAKAIRVYDYVISADQMSQLTDEFPYTSYGGKYTRTITANSNLSATDAWLNASTQGNVDVPVNAIVDAVTYYPDVEITTTAASTLTVNADMDAENIKFDGAGKLTIASDGSHNISIYGSVTANGPISLKYGEIDLTAVPVTIGESGSVEFDFSAYDFSGVTTSTDYPITGNTSDYGDKVTGVYPSDEDHTYSLAFNSTTNSYYLTVGPSVTLKQKQAIALVTPYYNGKHVGAGLNKYTISLGATQYADMFEFGTAVMSWESLGDCVEPTITLNTVPAGFYRFKAAARSANDDTNNWYMGSDADGIYSASTTASQATDVNTIFYLEQDANGYHPISFFTGRRSAGTAYHDVGDNSNFTLSQAVKADDTTLLYGEYKMVNGSDKTIVMWSNETLNAIDGNNDWSGWTIEEVESLPVTISAAKYATLYSPVALTIPTGVKAYAVTTKNTSTLHLEEITTTIPAETGVILYADVNTATTYDFDITTGGEGSSLLTGTVASIARVDNSYVLGNGSEGIAFYGDGPSTLTGFKAYYVAAAGNIKAFTFDIDDIETAVRAIEAAQNPEKVVYDLNGRRVMNPAKGLYIVNGKKVIIK